VDTEDADELFNFVGGLGSGLAFDIHFFEPPTVAAQLLQQTFAF
jgi:hypothetical protein